MATSEVIQDDVLLYYVEKNLALFTDGLKRVPFGMNLEAHVQVHAVLTVEGQASIS